MILSMKLERLHQLLRTLGPVVGIDGTVGNVVITYDPAPTAQQESDVNAAIAAFDWSDAADNVWYENLNPERKDLKDQAADAIVRLDQIINAANPTNAQVIAAIRDMARYEKAIIKRLIQIM